MKGIYAIINKINGKCYVGSTSVSLKSRFKSHRSMLRNNKHHSPSLQRAWNKSGEDCFAFMALEQVEDEGLVLIREQHWIKEFNAAHPKLGYNVCPVAGTRSGTKQPEEMKERYRLERTGVKKSAEHCRNISEGQRGKVLTDEHRRKISEAAKKQWSNPENRAAQSERKKGKPSAFKGKKHSEESILSFKAAAMTEKRLAISKANLPVMTDEIRAKISATKTGKRLGIPRVDPRTPTESQITEMKDLRASGLTYAKIGLAVGRDVATVHKYLNKK